MPNFSTHEPDESPEQTDDVSRPSRLVAVRRRAPEPELPEGFDAEPVPFDEGESLDEATPFDPEVEPEQARLFEELREAARGPLPWSDPDSDPLGDVRRFAKRMQDEYRPEDDPIIGTAIVDKGFTNEPPLIRHECPVTPCTWFLEVPAVETKSVAGLLGGVSLAQLEQAREVEERLTEHLHTHSVMDWLTALRQAQSSPSQVVQPGIREGYASQDVIPGPAKRDPVREAAVRAVDARLGRNGGPVPTDALDAATRDDLIRAEFQRKRQTALTPLDTTPRWRQDQEAGQVGIKY